MKLKQLETFVVVAEELHFGRAARRLNRTQPPISRQIHQLETSLGVELFTRSTQHVALTAAGRVFLKEIRPALAGIQQASQAALRAARGHIGSITIGVTPSLMFGSLPQLFSAFKTQYPDITLHLHLASKADQLKDLKENKLHIAFVRSLSHEHELIHETLLEEALVVAMARSNPLTARAQIQLADLQNENFILYRGQAKTSVADQIIAACHQTGFSPRIIQETDDMQSAAALAALNTGITLIASSLQKIGLADLVCKPVLMDTSPLTIPLYMVYPRYNNEQELTLFLELARQNYQTS